MEFPRFITQYNQTPIPSGAYQQIQSQTITLPQIPDMFLIYAKPSVGAGGGPLGPEDADFYLPLATAADGVRNPVSFNFDNFSGLLSSVTAEQLYAMSVNNGLEMDWNSFAGYAHSQSPLTTGGVGVGSGRIPTVGSILCLRPSKDITLQTGQAPSLVGNFTFQFNINIKNNTPQAQSPTLFVITVNSGFFETIRGSSRILKGVLSESDIISAEMAPMATHDALARYVGSGGLFSNLSNVLSKAKEVYEKTKPIGQAIRGVLPEGTVKSAMGMAGYGTGGAMGMGTGAGTGGGTGGRRRMADRLM
jgi:hypothetical protein